ncbi:hypothetical protein GF389_05700 [Candidatus Dojkabacteria bacterium]|nr:hypothetical protein [Candidatus Dojkabacteria bacterium]
MSTQRSDHEPTPRPSYKEIQGTFATRVPEFLLENYMIGAPNYEPSELDPVQAGKLGVLVQLIQDLYPSLDMTTNLADYAERTPTVPDPLPEEPLGADCKQQQRFKYELSQAEYNRRPTPDLTHGDMSLKDREEQFRRTSAVSKAVDAIDKISYRMTLYEQNSNTAIAQNIEALTLLTKGHALPEITELGEKLGAAVEPQFIEEPGGRPMDGSQMLSTLTYEHPFEALKRMHAVMNSVKEEWLPEHKRQITELGKAYIERGDVDALVGIINECIEFGYLEALHLANDAIKLADSHGEVISPEGVEQIKEAIGDYREDERKYLPADVAINLGFDPEYGRATTEILEKLNNIEISSDPETMLLLRKVSDQEVCAQLMHTQIQRNMEQQENTVASLSELVESDPQKRRMHYEGISTDISALMDANLAMAIAIRNSGTLDDLSTYAINTNNPIVQTQTARTLSKAATNGLLTGLDWDPTSSIELLMSKNNEGNSHEVANLLLLEQLQGIVGIDKSDTLANLPVHLDGMLEDILSGNYEYSYNPGDETISIPGSEQQGLILASYALSQIAREISTHPTELDSLAKKTLDITLHFSIYREKEVILEVAKAIAQKTNR